ncbi:hypothetical protein [Streptacidiphilus jiangxiensis]|uniref:Uncharacterized protein n=1 Tax=Streptacidiphilus jiangxiensis TaxID=235985 RepID=A0A1H7JPU9_STRJI|nr:hypothetical protein [Streptacidiphilus jiangxiensis]SEK75980.1 hypothetical protein SAMN05414137_103375 [Streptacidiphilus jiangxiensis]
MSDLFELYRAFRPSAARAEVPTAHTALLLEDLEQGAPDAVALFTVCVIAEPMRRGAAA